MNRIVLTLVYFLSIFFLTFISVGATTVATDTTNAILQSLGPLLNPVANTPSQGNSGTVSQTQAPVSSGIVTPNQAISTTITPPVSPVPSVSHTASTPPVYTPPSVVNQQTSSFPTITSSHQNSSVGNNYVITPSIPSSASSQVVVSSGLSVLHLYGKVLNTIPRATASSAYILTYDSINRFFRADGNLKYIDKDTVLRITSNRHKYYIQVPVQTNGTWNVFDTTTPGYILAAFLQKDSNLLTFSYYDVNKKTFRPSGIPQLSIIIQ